LVYKLIKLSLLLPVATASVERVFSAMNLVKTDIRSSMGDKWINDCLITFIEKKIFNTVDIERIMQRFQNMKGLCKGFKMKGLCKGFKLHLNIY
jgi:hAT family C-terminal dimerisation region